MGGRVRKQAAALKLSPQLVQGGHHDVCSSCQQCLPGSGAAGHTQGHHGSSARGAHVPGRIPYIPAAAARDTQLLGRVKQQVGRGLRLGDG